MKAIEICNNVIYRGVELVAAKHLSEKEIQTQQHIDCCFCSDGKPFCGNCRFGAYDPETVIHYCTASRRV